MQKLLGNIEKSKLKGLRKHELNSGQALLITLLVMAIVLSVALSVVARSVTDVSITSYEEEALRAFSAAEAGIEEVLNQNAPLTSVSSTLTPDTGYSTNPEFPNPGNIFNYPDELMSGETATFWMVSHDDAGQKLTCSGKPCFRGNKISQICWGDVGPYYSGAPASYPAIELSLWYDETFQSVSSNNYADVQIKRVLLDPNSSRGSASGAYGVTISKSCSGNKCNKTCTLNGKDYAFRAQNLVFNLPNPLYLDNSCRNNTGCLLMIRTRMLYNNVEPHFIGMEANAAGGTSLGNQGVTIESTGTSGESTRKLTVFKGYQEPPFIFDATLYSGKGIEKP
jgi:type II secretory pathway pseudopilin PulG